MHHGPFKIGIDCRLSGNTHAGIGRYIENLILRLPFSDPQFSWVLFFHDQKQVPQTPALQTAIAKGVVTIDFVPVRHYSLAEQVVLPRHLASYKLSLLHVPHFNVPLWLPSNLPLIVTIHDLLWHQHRGTRVTTLAPWIYWLKYMAYQLVTRHAVHRAHTILVPSKIVSQTVTNYYPHVAKKIKVTYEGVNESPVTTAKTTPKTLLYVGSLYPHKNVARILHALQQLPDYKLQIVGSRSAFLEALIDQAKELHVDHQVVTLGYLPDHELNHHYQTATALIQPSLSEGFGLTGLEAMAAGGVVLASDIPIFHEIYGKAAGYFDPTSTDSLVAAIKNLDQQDYEHLRQQGRQQVSLFSWQTMTNQTIASYREVLNATN